MRPRLVVDIGNSRMKWGRVHDGTLSASASLDPDDPAAWTRQADEWALSGELLWVAASVHPRRTADFLDWLTARGCGRARVLAAAAELPLKVELDEPDKVGIDRLLAAVAANARRPPERGAIVVSVGTATTVDMLAPDGAFLGGAILPGPRLMAQALHEHTALLPLVEELPPWPEAPGKATRPAIQLGIHWATVGAVNGLIGEMSRTAAADPGTIDVLVTGGGAAAVFHRLIGNTAHRPDLVLEGICITAEALS